MPYPLQFLLNNVDITNKVKDAVIEKQEKRGADQCEFHTLYNVSVSINDDVKVKDVTSGNFVFGGKVTEVDEEYALIRVVALSYGKVFDEIRVFPSRVYNNASPEAIVNDLRANYFSDFTLSAGASGVTIKRYEASGTISENLRILANIAGFDFWTEVTSAGGKVLYFRPANTDLGKTLYLGKVGATLPNAYREAIERDDSQLFNAVEVYGRNKTENIYHRWDLVSGTFSEFYFPRAYYSVGAKFRGNRLIEGPDFVYEPELRRLKTNWPLAGGTDRQHSFEIEAQADATPIAYSINSSSVSTYGLRVASVFLEKVSEKVDIGSFASKFLQLHSQPRLTLKVRKPGLDFGIRNGGFVTVYDPLAGINGQTFIVRVVRWKYPEGVTEMLLSHFEPELYDFQRGISFRVESSAKSHIQSRDFGMVEKKFYFNYPSNLVETMNDLGAGGFLSDLNNTSPQNFIRMRLIVGSMTYDSRDTALAYVPNPGTTEYQYMTIYTQPFTIDEQVFDPPTNLTIRVQFYLRNNYGDTTEYLFAPDNAYPTFYYSIIIPNVRKVLRSTIGCVLYIRRNSDYIELGQGNYFPSNMFNFGLQIA